MSIDLYASVAGINAFFTKMDVTAHNVANLNTDNYKRRTSRHSKQPGRCLVHSLMFLCKNEPRNCL